ncbi:hypothetical protein [Hamadaea tsunoensis]|uniref:hypothetical protein n=1 Tax=Hamadaea tsunoensis TaxID=53368 RepID=UPI000420A549|nr:hypothetical protein [Hamadaea tsunoensis]
MSTVVAAVGVVVLTLLPPRTAVDAWRGATIVGILVLALFVFVAQRTSAWTVSAFRVLPDAAEFRVGMRPVGAAFPLILVLLLGAGVAGMTWPTGGWRLLWLLFLAVPVWLVVGFGSSPSVGALTPAGLKVSPGLGRVRTYGWDEDLTAPTRLLCTGDVYPDFVRAAVDYYRTFPEFRDRIGDPAEHRRLYAEVVSAYARGRQADVAHLMGDD